MRKCIFKRKMVYVISNFWDIDLVCCRFALNVLKSMVITAELRVAVVELMFAK